MLNKINNSRYHNDNEQAQRTAKEQLKIILANKSKLQGLRNGKKLYVSAVGMSKIPKLTDNQLSYVDVIYEKTMGACGLPSFNATFKPKKRKYT